MAQIVLNTQTISLRNGVGSVEMPKDLVLLLTKELHDWYNNLLPELREMIIGISADPYSDAEFGNTDISLWLFGVNGKSDGLAISGDLDGVDKVKNTMTMLLLNVFVNLDFLPVTSLLPSPKSNQSTSLINFM
jgi:hypothetical protein